MDSTRSCRKRNKRVSHPLSHCSGERGGSGFACQEMLDYRRKLPHWQPHETPIFITWCQVHRRRRRESLTASRRLSDDRVALVLTNTICIGESERQFYQVHAWSMMPNHVHLLITPRFPLPVITRWIKGSFDRWVRSQTEFDRIVRYIEQNPVKAGFVNSPALWPRSSAVWQAIPPAPPWTSADQ